MQTAIRLKQYIKSEKVMITHPELKELIGKEVEIIILANNDNDESISPQALQNSSHIAGSYILDEEAMKQLLESRFK